MQNPIHGKLCFLRAACVLAVLVGGAPSEAADITYETRALTGTDGPLGPGLGAGVTFSSFNAPALNANGRTAFRGVLTGSGVTILNNAGIWSEGSGSGLSLVARKGDHAPGTEVGATFDLFRSPVFIGAGQTAFSAFLTGPGVDSSNSDGIWSGGGGSGLALVARSGSQAPGTAAGVNFSGFLNLSGFNGAGQTVFQGILTGVGVDSTNDHGIWSEGGGSGLTLVARKGDHAPGMAAGVNFGDIGIPRLNGAGQTAFQGGLTGSGVDSSNNEGIWSEGGGAGLVLIAREGSRAPGTADGVNFGGLQGMGDPKLNAAGQTAFISSLNGEGVDSSNNEGIWSEGGGAGLALVARTGSQAPGTADGVNFRGFNYPAVLNDAGQTAFIGYLGGLGVDSTNNFGIWSEGGGAGLALVARKGDHAPGTGEGVIFAGFVLDRLFSAPVLNGAGQTAFRGFLSGPGVDGSNGHGVWATDLNGLVHLIVRTGDLFDVNNDPLIDDLRTISFVELFTNSGGGDGRPTSFNDAGQFAFRLEFTDGSSGIFVANIAGPSTSTFNLTITRATAPATGYDLEWESQPGKVYDLVTSTDPTTPLAEWPVHASYGDIPATGTTTTLRAVPAAGPQRFFAVIEK